MPLCCAIWITCSHFRQALQQELIRDYEKSVLTADPAYLAYLRVKTARSGAEKMSRGAAAREALVVFTGASTVVKAVSIVLGLVYLTSWDPSGTAMRVLSVRPGYFWPPHFWLWTAATHCFFEIHIWEVLIDVVTIVLVGKLLEPLWGAIEMLVFFAVVNIGVAILSAFFYYILYMVTFNTELLFDVHIHGNFSLFHSKFGSLLSCVFFSRTGWIPGRSDSGHQAGHA